MITLTVESTVVKALDHIPLKQHLINDVGIEAEELETVNQFTYGSLPEGSFGKFLIKSSEVPDLQTGLFDVVLKITGQEESFTHNALMVTKVQFFSEPISGLSDYSSNGVAIVHVQDIFAALDDIIRKDYNRISSYLVSDTGNLIEPLDADLNSFTEILQDVLASFPIDGTPPALSLTGLPSFKPRNILSAGTTIKDLFQFIADGHFLTCYADASYATPGRIVITNAQISSQLVPQKSRVIYSEYGSELLSEQLNVVFSNLSSPLSVIRSPVIDDYYTAFADEWTNETKTLTASDDATLPNNARFTSGATTESVFYPFYDSGDYGVEDTLSGTIADQLAANYVARTQRFIKIVYKDILNIVPCASVHSIVFRYTEFGYLTEVRSKSPERLQIDSMLALTSRSPEIVPETQVGTVPSLGAVNPGSSGTITIGSFSLPYTNASTQKTFEDETIAVHYNLNTRRYEFTDRCERLFQYELTSGFASHMATAKRLSMDGVDSGEVVTVRDPLGIVDSQEIGDFGYMVYTVEDEYYAVLPDMASIGSILSPQIYRFTLTSDLAQTPGSTATADAEAANTVGGATSSITVVNPGQWRAFTGATGLAIKLSTTLYWILVVDQPALRVLVQLDTHPTSSRFGADPRETNAAIKTSSPAPVKLTPFPFGFLPTQDSSVPNPRQLFGEAGDYAIMAWDPVSEDYFLEEVFPQRQQELWATLASNRPNGLASTMSCTPAAPASDGTFPSSPFNVVDKYNVAINAKSGDQVLVKWHAGDAGYRAIAAQHTATRCKALLFGSFSGAPLTFQVDTVSGMDGAAPTFTTSMTVSNRFGWDSGVDNADVEIVWDTHLGSWYAVQMDCPP